MGRKEAKDNPSRPLKFVSYLPRDTSCILGVTSHVAVLYLWERIVLPNQLCRPLNYYEQAFILAVVIRARPFWLFRLPFPNALLRCLLQLWRR